MKLIRILEIILVFFCLFLSGGHLSAQEFGTHWISYPNADNSSEIWFRKTYITYQKPSQAKITIAATGHYQIFVNERNISREVLLPGPSDNAGTIQEMTFDISNILREDSNTIAIWYAPDPKLHTDKQISLSYYGTSKYGQPFYYQTGEDWSCKKACGYVTANQEYLDNRSYDPSWKACTTEVTNWTSAVRSTDVRQYPLRDNSYYHQGYKVTKILHPEMVFCDTNSITYRFPRQFTGWVRLTIRNAHSGETIHLNNYTYICNGRIDEQACRRFTTDSQHDLVVEGDQYFQTDQIQNIEGLVIQPDQNWAFE